MHARWSARTQVPGWWAFPTVLVIGIVTRLALVPFGHGQDFVVWDKASAATLHGINIYAHHPNYPAGPFAYLPLFLYLELPFRWLALHLGWSFLVLGKIPILAADVAVAWLVRDEVARRGASLRVQAVAAAAFFLNPLVLYNGAWYGRFDSLTCALLLYALRLFQRHGAASRSAVGWYALAVAAKPFPGFALPGVLRAARGHRVRTAIIFVAVIAALCMPYLGTLHPFLHDVIGYDLAKTPQGVSWQTLLPRIVDAEDVHLTGQVLLTVFALGTLLLTTVRAVDRYVLLTIVLFLCCSKLVLDQYLTWPLPLLAITATCARGRSATWSAGLLVLLTTIGMFANATIDPFGRSPAAVDVALALACASYIAVVVHDTHRQQPIMVEVASRRLRQAGSAHHAADVEQEGSL